MMNDLGLIHLIEPLDFGDTVQAAVLAQKEFAPTGRRS